jgi:hypothetical protein
LNGSRAGGILAAMPPFIRASMLLGALATLCLLTASAQATHPRPKSATPLQMSLVPAYAPCAAPNRTHGPALAFPSCNPPVQASTQATVGTPDAFGGAANATGYLRLTAWESIPGGPAEGDILIDMEVKDVRCVPTGSRCGAPNASGPADYSGEMRFSFALRLTDHHNQTWPDPLVAATVQDFTIEHSWACAPSGSTSTGSTCSLNTSLNTLMPEAGGPVLATRREVWELQDVRIYDGGPDGDADTTADNTVFMRPGVFIP